MKKRIVFILFLLLMPFIVKAHTATLNPVEHAELHVAPIDNHYTVLDPTNLYGGSKYYIVADVEEGYVIDGIEVVSEGGDLVPLSDYLTNKAYGFNMPQEDITVTFTIVPIEKQIDPVPTLSEDYVASGDKCLVLNGNGKNLGDEVVCGTEHFYVLSNDGNSVRLFAKHNLNVGVNIYREKINKKSNDSRSNKAYCLDLAVKKNNALLKTNSYYAQDEYCYYQISPETPEVVKQSINHSSAHFDKNGNYLYPQAGDVYVNYEAALEIDSSITYSDESYSDFLISPDNETFGSVLAAYIDTLSKMIGNDSITDIDLLSLSDLESIAKTKANKSFPLKEWGDDIKAIPWINEGFIVGRIIYNTEATFGKISDYIPNDYKWLWSTSYWLSTTLSADNTFRGKYYMFVASLGKICGSGMQYCASATELGTGIRPVITISSSKLKYRIKTKTDGHGTIEVIEEADGDDEITFKVDSEEGYVLGELTVITDGGEIIKFDEGEYTTNKDGSITITKNRFKMPFDNVTIIASFEPKNPETIDNALIVGAIMLISLTACLTLYMMEKNIKKAN